MKTRFVRHCALLTVCACSTVAQAGEPLKIIVGDDYAAPRPVYGRPWMGPLIMYSTRVSREEAYENSHRRLHIMQINHKIKLAQAEVEALERHVREYEERFSNTQALLVSRDRAKLSLLAAKLRLKELRAQKRLMLRTRLHSTPAPRQEELPAPISPADGPIARAVPRAVSR